MVRFLHHLSAVVFYILGSTFFLALVLLKNGVGASVAAWWMQVADLPTALSAIVYGGLSFLLSFDDGQSHRLLPYLVWVPLSGFFLLLLVLNFWGAL